jgi:hypothetical protein
MIVDRNGDDRAAIASTEDVVSFEVFAATGDAIASIASRRSSPRNQSELAIFSAAAHSGADSTPRLGVADVLFDRVALLH